MDTETTSIELDDLAVAILPETRNRNYLQRIRKTLVIDGLGNR
ncbi:MAG: hypothetical protein NXH85_07055 [Pseudomonadaceae bacterium]|nr:hypothetical protein [Pseudomonadaceae bacterium]